MTTHEPPRTLFNADDEPLPVLPYRGTSGWSGSDTSEDRARRADQDGTTGRRQRQTLMLLNFAGYAGLTWKELSDLTGAHHGSASGALSVLHKAGLIARLKARRNRCAVYVGLDHVDDRDLAPYRTNAGTRTLLETLDRLEDLLVAGDHRQAIIEVRTLKRSWQ